MDFYSGSQSEKEENYPWRLFLSKPYLPGQTNNIEVEEKKF